MNSHIVHCVANGIAIKFSLPDYIRLLSKSNLLSFLFHKRDIYIYILIKLFFKMFSFVPKKRNIFTFICLFPLSLNGIYLSVLIPIYILKLNLGHYIKPIKHDAITYEVVLVRDLLDHINP